MSENEVHVWVARPERASSPALVERYKSLLLPEEAKKYAAFYFDQHRHEYLITRALERSVLARYVDRDPWSLRFVRNEYGRPYLDPPTNVLFNLSNTTGLIVLIVSTHCEVGADVEPLTRGPDIVEIADTVFAPRELRELRALPKDRAHRRAVELWTLKESYIKARGMGLSLALDKFAFRFDEPRVRVDIEPELSDHGSNWWFKMFEHGTHHIATCVRARKDSDLRVVVREMVPFSEGATTPV